MILLEKGLYNGCFKGLINVPDSNDTFTILSTSAAKWWKSDLKKLIGKVSKQHVEDLIFCTVFIVCQTKF